MINLKQDILQDSSGTSQFDRNNPALSKDYFKIDSDNGEVRFLQSADYETKSSYLFDVVVSDGELSDRKTIHINIADDLSDNQLNLDKEDLALKEEHYGGDLADKMDAGDLLSDLKLHGGKGNDDQHNSAI